MIYDYERMRFKNYNVYLQKKMPHYLILKMAKKGDLGEKYAFAGWRSKKVWLGSLYMFIFSS